MLERNVTTQLENFLQVRSQIVLKCNETKQKIGNAGHSPLRIWDVSDP